MSGLKRRIGTGSSTITQTKTKRARKDKDEWMPKSRAGGHVPLEQQIASTSSLDSFLGVSANSAVSTPRPSGAIVASSEVVDRDSTFIAHAAAATTAEEAKRFQKFVRETHRSDPASHELAGWRVFTVKKGRSGAGDDDFEVTTGCDVRLSAKAALTRQDDGEKNGGSTILRALDREKTLDVAVVVSRWFGVRRLRQLG